MDIYASFSELSKSEKEDIDYQITVIKQKNSDIVIIAPHGGAIEPGTSEVVKSIAAKDLSIALFEGIKPKNNKHLHITSTNFDEPRCTRLIQESRTVIAVHGEKSLGQSVFIGGRDVELIKHITSALHQFGYQVKTHENPELQGLSSANICNRGRYGRGVQLELSAGLRQLFFQPNKKMRPTHELKKFSLAIRKGLFTSLGTDTK